MPRKVDVADAEEGKQQVLFSVEEAERDRKCWKNTTDWIHQGGLSLSLCELGTRLSTFKFQHKFGITTITTSLCSTTERFKLEKQSFQILWLCIRCQSKKKKTFLYESQVSDLLLQFVKTGYYFLGCYWSASESHQILQHFSKNCYLSNKISHFKRRNL